jgi:hypothetical protein
MIFELEKSKTTDTIQLNDGIMYGKSFVCEIIRISGDGTTVESPWFSSLCRTLDDARLSFLRTYAFGNYFSGNGRSLEELAIRLELLGF